MTRLRISRPAEHWTESVVIRSYEVPLSDPDPPLLVAPPATPAAPVRLPKVLPAWLVAAALLLAGTGSVAAALWWQHRSRVIDVTNRVQPYYSAGPDAAGCPILSRCRVVSTLGEPLTEVARALFPDATVLSSLAVVESGSGRTVQTTVVLAEPSGLEVSASAQCVPGDGPITSRTEPLPTVGPAQADFVVPGAPGCSVAVAAQIPRGVRVPSGELAQLAYDPQVQLDQ